MFTMCISKLVFGLIKNIHLKHIRHKELMHDNAQGLFIFEGACKTEIIGKHLLLEK